MTPEVCPNCGAEVPPGARACPECGSCPETGWSDEPDVGGLGLPDDAFDYEDYVKGEFGSRAAGRGRGNSALWCAATALVLVVLWLLFH